MHIIESGDLAKPVATLSPLTKLSGNDAYYSTYRNVRKSFEDWIISALPPNREANDAKSEALGKKMCLPCLRSGNTECLNLG